MGGGWMRKRIVLFGASGFVGGAVRAALSADHDVIGVVAPRLSTQARDCGALLAEVPDLELPAGTATALAGADVVINAAGDPDASSLDEGRLSGANALLPALVLEHARRAGARRLEHVSSAGVQNDKPLLEHSEEMERRTSTWCAIARPPCTQPGVESRGWSQRSRSRRWPPSHTQGTSPRR